MLGKRYFKISIKEHLVIFNTTYPSCLNLALLSTKRLLIGLIILSTVFPAAARARDLVISLPLLPPLVEADSTGHLLDLARAMDRVYTDGRIKIIGPYPFVRSLKNVMRGTADMHMPILLNPLVKESDLGFSHSSDTIFKVDFALYTHKDNPYIRPGNLARFSIETVRGHCQYFDFNIKGSSSIESSLRKLSLQRIDGFVFSMTSTDIVLNKLGLTRVKRWYYNTFDVKMVLPKETKKQKKIDAILAGLIQQLKQTGEYDKIMGPISWLKFSDTL